MKQNRNVKIRRKRKKRLKRNGDRDFLKQTLVDLQVYTY